MSKTKIDCEQAVCLSQELFHAHFPENLKNGFIPFPGQHLSGHRGTGVIRQRRHPGPFQGFSGILRIS